MRILLWLAAFLLCKTVLAQGGDEQPLEEPDIARDADFFPPGGRRIRCSVCPRPRCICNWRFGQQCIYVPRTCFRCDYFACVRGGIGFPRPPVWDGGMGGGFGGGRPIDFNPGSPLPGQGGFPGGSGGPGRGGMRAFKPDRLMLEGSSYSASESSGDL